MLAGCQAQRPPQSKADGMTPTVLDVSGPRSPHQPSVYVMPTATPAAYGAPAASSGPAYLPPGGSDLSAPPTPSYATAQPQLVASAPDAPAIAPKSVGVQAKTYLVKRGDTLFRIAKEHYGSGSKWKRIAAANPGLTPATLKAGQKLLMP
jgi:5'-nucleotidase